ncbi:MAG TPA: ABC transporter ATP-binding protein [Leptolinea sp.]
MASVTLDHVWKTYNAHQKNAVDAVKDANLLIQDGDFVALLGPSGCGKTSILRMIAGLEYISKGAIKIGDIVVNGLSPDQRNIAMAFETYALYPHFTVYENLEFCLKARNYDKKDIANKINDTLKELKIDHLAKKRPSELPGGQQQMVSVARAMVRQPNVFLLDEPFSHIDAAMRVGTRAAIKTLVNESKTTTILVTHDQHEAVAMADKIVVMNFAEIQQYGTAHDLIHKPANLFVANFVGEPAINLFTCELIKNEKKFVLIGKDLEANIPVSTTIAELIYKTGSNDVVIGIRPQELTVASGNKGFIKGNAALFEFLGEEGHLIIDSKQSSVTIVTEPHLDIKKGDSVYLNAMSNEIFLFDPITKRAICHGIG